jgi:hypothetical protein
MKSGTYEVKHLRSGKISIATYFADDNTLTFAKTNKTVYFDPKTSKVYKLQKLLEEQTEDTEDTDEIPDQSEEQGEFFIEACNKSAGRQAFRVVRILSDGGIQIFGTYSSEVAAILVRNRLNTGKLLGW